MAKPQSSSTSYHDYISELCGVTDFFQGLQDFFSGEIKTLDSAVRSGSRAGSQDPGHGTITIADFLESKLSLQTFQARGAYSAQERQNIHKALDTTPSDCGVRLIFVDYFRDWNYGYYVGLDKDVIGSLMVKYKIHPSTLRLHFGSPYGLDTFFHGRTGDATHGLSHCTRTQCMLLRYGHGFLTATCIAAQAPNEPASVIVIARNASLENHSEKLCSDLMLLDSDFPDPDLWKRHRSQWTNSIFLRHLSLVNENERKAIRKLPLECLAIYGLMTAEIEMSSMYIWEGKVRDYSISQDLTVRYQEQGWQVQKMKANEANMRRFAGASPSPRYALSLETLSSTLAEAERLWDDLRLLMNYRASLASLKESQTSVECAQLSIQQAGQVKILTQLAFIFVPLGAISSMFGMNLTELESGSARIWMFVVGAVVAYTLVFAVWGVLSNPSQRWLWRSFKRFSRNKNDPDVVNEEWRASDSKS